MHIAQVYTTYNIYIITLLINKTITIMFIIFIELRKYYWCPQNAEKLWCLNIFQFQILDFSLLLLVKLSL